MFTIRFAIEGDKEFWLSLDRHISADEWRVKIMEKRAHIILDEKKPVGVLRYNLFWDEIPFLTMLCLAENSRGKGLGRLAMQYWENEMGRAGHKMVMTSTMVNEQAQHFYRKLGYIERGSLFLDGTPLAQPQEMLMLKVLSFPGTPL